MTSINFRKESAHRLDIEKRKLEASVILPIQRVFRNMARDAANLYKMTGSVPIDSLANNYKADFTKEIRDALRKTVKKFGFRIRDNLQKKHNLDFNTEMKIFLIDIDVKAKIKIVDESTDEKLENINTQFQGDATLFIANESEVQSNFVEKTNAKMVEAAIAVAILQFNKGINEASKKINMLSQRLIGLSGKERSVVERQIGSLQRNIELQLANRNKRIADNIETNLLKKVGSRSKLISAQNVGLAESWARQKEAELIHQASLVTEKGGIIMIDKEWVAILDSKTRPEHVSADGQIRSVEEFYQVGGENLLVPRDPRGSAKNIMECRCESMEIIREAPRT